MNRNRFPILHFHFAVSAIFYSIGEDKELTLPSSLSISLSDLSCCPCLFFGVRREESLVSTCPLGYRLRLICPKQKLTLSREVCTKKQAMPLLG